MRYRRHLAVLLSVVMLFASCVDIAQPSERTPLPTSQAQWDCEDVVDEKLKAFPFQIPGDTVIVWIQDQYRIELTDIHGGPSGDDGKGEYRYWWVGQRRYDVTRRLDARDSALVQVRWDKQAPSLAVTLRCLGAPPLYRAYLSPTEAGSWTVLELWYPERGIMVMASVTHKTSEMTTDQAVAHIAYVQPGSPEELITRFFVSTTRGSDRYMERLKGLKPWPGDISQVAIDEGG